MKTKILILLFSIFLPFAYAQDEKPDTALSLEELLELVQQGKFAESEEASEREQKFARERSRQATLLANAKAERARLEAIATELEGRFEANDAKLVVLEEQLKTRLGSLYETFGHLQGVASDTQQQFESAVTSGQFGQDREIFLKDLAKRMGEGISLASVQELERLWYELQRELIASGNVQKFQATVVDNEGQTSQQDVVRVGNFNAVTEGEYLTYLPARGAYETLPRQPGRYLGGTYDVHDSSTGFVEFAIDPTGPQGGALLTNLISLPSFFEQIQYGRITGYTIINLDKNVKKEASGSKLGNNPLSRIFDVAEQNKGSDVETLELKLAEQILVERASIDTGIWLVRLISVVAPLLGLFGTITGMINTFQAITLFGTGDPKTMANGISEALVTTMLGLMTAIPATFMAAIMANYAKNILTVLEEQSTGMIAAASEENKS